MGRTDEKAITPGPDGLIPAAMRDSATRGRSHAETEHPFRNPFQRDRDRVIHSGHFRRLEYKTQVFVNGEGDNYRTRLTHTLEVTQIARSIARALRINEDLAEAVALSHDIGHTPFGHAGERVLNDLLRDEGGFDHNLQGLRIVDVLENRYAAFRGLNLTFEVREAFFQHSGKRLVTEMEEFDADSAPLLEVAATLVSDDIAYIAHDVDDGLYSGFIKPEQLEEISLWRQATGADGFRDFRPELKRTEGVRRLINSLVTDVVFRSVRAIGEQGYMTADDVRSGRTRVVDFSPEMEKKKNELKEFLFRNFYRHPNVMRVMEEAQKKVRDLWRFYIDFPEKMPHEYQGIADIRGVRRAAGDYVAGMTDRFVHDEYRKHIGSE